MNVTFGCWGVFKCVQVAYRCHLSVDFNSAKFEMVSLSAFDLFWAIVSEKPKSNVRFMDISIQFTKNTFHIAYGYPQPDARIYIYSCWLCECDRESGRKRGRESERFCGLKITWGTSSKYLTRCKCSASLRLLQNRLPWIHSEIILK